MKQTQTRRRAAVQSLIIATLSIPTLSIPAGRACADRLTVYAIPTPYGNDYSSPRRLAMSTDRNYRTGQTYQYGHTAFHLQCDPAKGEGAGIDIFDGINAVNLAEGEYLTRRKGYGFGVMFTILSGHFEGRETTTQRVQSYMDAGAAAFVRFEISSAACRRMASFYEEYKSLGVPENYGLYLRPRHKEGANCATFAAALLEIGGLADPGLMDSWRVALRVPTYVVGGPLTGRFIPPWFFFARPFWARHWASPYDHHYFIEFYDPDLLYNHIRNRWQNGLSPVDNAELPARMTHNGSTRGFDVDAKSLATPDEPFWRSQE